MESKPTILSSLRRAFRSSSTKVNGKSPVTKRKELSSVRVFPEENAERRYEDIGDFTAKTKKPAIAPKQKKSRKPKHTMSETRRGQERPVSSAVRGNLGTVLTNHKTKSATLPSGIRVSRPAPPPPVNHTIRIPPPRHSRKLPFPLSSPASPIHHNFGFPNSRPLPHTLSALDCSITSPTLSSASQHKTAINISRTGPSTLPYDYSEPLHWLQQRDSDNPTYSSIPPKSLRDYHHCGGPHRSAWNDNKYDEDHFQHEQVNLQVSASMIELRDTGSDHGYMEINRSTLELPTVACDYQQPIALRRLPGPPLAVKERQQRREEQRLLRGTIVVLDENKTLEI